MLKTTKLISVFLAILFVVYTLPLTVLADEFADSEEVVFETEEVLDEILPDTPAEDTPETEYDNLATDIVQENLSEAELVGEVTELREENVKHFRMAGGLYTAVDYGMAVHYEENEEWVDYDNTLVLEEAEDSDDVAGYSPQKSDVKIKFSPNTSNPNMVKLKYDKYQLRISLEGADKTKAIQVNNPTAGEVTDVLDPLPELTSSVRYNDILTGTDLEYIVTGSNIKENIIVKEKGESYVYEFNLRVKDITPVISDDGDVLFVNENGDTVFNMPKGYMYDSEGNRSEDVTYTVEANGNKKYVLTVTADADWINEEGRAFPVTVDPTVITEKYSSENTNIETDYVYVSNGTLFPNTDHMYVGYTTSVPTEMVMYTKFNEKPTLPSNSVLCDAQVIMAQIGYSSWTSGYVLNVGAYEVTGSPWASGIANRTNISSTMLDYVQLRALDVDSDNNLVARYIDFNITEAVKSWYGDSSQTSLEIAYASPTYQQSFTNSDAANATFAGCYSSSSNLSVGQPRLVVTYRHNVGLESYYTYETHDAGRAGTVYVANNSGESTVVKPLVTSSSDTFPFTLSMIHNSQYSKQQFTKNNSAGIYTSDFSNMVIANGWKLSVQQSIVPLEISTISVNPTTETYLVYTDADGTQHYFSEDPNNAGTYLDEDGLGLKITSDSAYYYMTDDKENGAKFVKSTGRLIRNYDAVGNEILYHYSGTISGQLSSIAWKNVGNAAEKTVCTFTYDTSNRLTSITDYAGRVTSFTYTDTETGTSEVKVTHPDQTSAIYAFYNTDYKLSRIRDNESVIGIMYTCDSAKRVKTAQVYGYDSGTEVYSSYVEMSYPGTQRTEVISAGPDTSVSQT